MPTPLEGDPIIPGGANTQIQHGQFRSETRARRRDMRRSLRASGVAHAVALLVFMIVLSYGPRRIAQFAQYVTYRCFWSARLALSSKPIDTSWDAQSSFIQHRISQKPLDADVSELVLDLGAHDGIWQSNSHLFLQLGWKAILVEPHPKTFQQLQRNSERFRGLAQLVRAAVARPQEDGQEPEIEQARNGRVVDSGWIDGTENRVEDIRGAATADCSSDPKCVPMMPLVLLLKRLSVPRRFALLSLDVEWEAGTVAAALGTMFRSGYRPEFLIVENAQRARVMLRRFGYAHLLTVRDDEVYRLSQDTRPQKTRPQRIALRDASARVGSRLGLQAAAAAGVNAEQTGRVDPRRVGMRIGVEEDPFTP